jgi:hypothetical protein
VPSLDKSSRAPAGCDHYLSEAFAPVYRQHDQLLAGVRPDQLSHELGRTLILEDPLQCVDNGISGKPDCRRRDLFAQQVLDILLGSGKMVARQTRNEPSVHLLRERCPDVMSTKAGLYVTNRYIRVKCRERTR